MQPLVAKKFIVIGFSDYSSGKAKAVTAASDYKFVKLISFS